MPFDTLEEIIEAIDRDPELRKQLRDRILGDEFLELPAQVAALTASVNELAITLNEFMEATSKRFDEIDKRFDEHDRRFDEHDIRFDRVEGQIARVYDKLNAEFGQAKGRDFENKVVERAFLMTDAVKSSDGMELEYVRNLNSSELRALANPALNIADIPRGHLESFYFADLVIEAVDSANVTCYIAAEISYTCDEGDTERAMRNARLLERFTGKRSYAVVVGVSLDDRIHSVIESGAVHWYELDEELVISR